MRPGEQLLGLCQQASGTLLIASPFIKSGALNRILQALPAQTALDVYTRWRLDELATGVSDLDCFLQVQGHPGARMFLCTHLHGKIYVSGNQALVGSANLTGKGLGWAAASNLEILVPVASDSPELAIFLAELRRESFPATLELYALFKKQVDEFEGTALLDDSMLQEPGDDTQDTFETREAGDPRYRYWFPASRHPENLYRAYAGNAQELTAAAQECAQDDLLNLNPSPGMTRQMFYAFVQGQMLQQPVVRQLEAFLGPRPQRFGAVRAFLQDNFGTRGQDWNSRLQTLMRWLGEFLPGRHVYSRPRHTEIIGMNPSVETLSDTKLTKAGPRDIGAS